MLIQVKNATIIGPSGQTTGMFGDHRFRAPEVIQGRPYSYRADTWSVGVILYFILTLNYPFEETDSQTLVQRIVKSEPNYKELGVQGYSDNVVNLLQKLLQKDVKKRLNVGNYLSHKWFQKGGQGKENTL